MIIVPPLNPPSALQGARKADVKKAYKKLSLTEHPDKGGDEKRFVKITKGKCWSSTGEIYVELSLFISSVFAWIFPVLSVLCCAVSETQLASTSSLNCICQ